MNGDNLEPDMVDKAMFRKIADDRTKMFLWGSQEDAIRFRDCYQKALEKYYHQRQENNESH